MSIDTALVAARLRRLDPDARAAVLADCRRARGETVERDGVTVRVDRGGETVTFATSEAADADRVVDAAALCDLLCYGLARRDADRIATRHLGAPLGDLRPPLARRVAARASALATPAAVFVLVVAVAGVVVGGVAAGPDGSGAASTYSATSSTTTPSPTATVPLTPIGGPVAPEVSRVPGLGFGEVTDLQTLANAHERTGPDAYVARVKTAWVAPNSDVIARNVTLRVDGDRYRAAVVVRRNGDEAYRATVYGTGETRWVRTRGDSASVRRLRANATGPADVDPATLGATGVRAALATPETNVTGPVDYAGRTAYRVVGTGVPPNETDVVETYRVTAYVRPDGFVYAMTVEYTRPGPRGSQRRLEWRYLRTNATVERPLWLPEMGDD
ncbi:MAG: hypothetical protein ABEJ43_05165 [Haloferacaceae archaeon]